MRVISLKFNSKSRKCAYYISFAHQHKEQLLVRQSSNYIMKHTIESENNFYVLVFYFIKLIYNSKQRRFCFLGFGMVYQRLCPISLSLSLQLLQPLCLFVFLSPRSTSQRHRRRTNHLQNTVATPFPPSFSLSLQLSRPLCLLAPSLSSFNISTPPPPH